jgi:hypothetical protein
LVCLVGFRVRAIRKCASGIGTDGSVEVLKVAVCASTATGQCGWKVVACWSSTCGLGVVRGGRVTPRTGNVPTSGSGTCVGRVIGDVG